MTNKKESKIWIQLFIALLSFNAIVALGLGATSLLNFQFALETGFQIPYSSELEILGLTIGLELLLLAAIAILSVVWVSKGKIEGTITGIFVGIYIFTFGIAAFLKFGETQALYVDSIRGFLTLVFGYLAYKKMKNA